MFVSKYTGICTKIFNVFNVRFKELTLAVDAVNYIQICTMMGIYVYPDFFNARNYLYIEN